MALSLRVVAATSGLMALSEQGDTLSVSRATGWRVSPWSEQVGTAHHAAEVMRPVGQGMCLVFQRPVMVLTSSKELIADGLYAFDNATIAATAFSCVPEGGRRCAPTAGTTHLRANMNAIILSSIAAGDGWQTDSEARPNCARAPLCNSINMSWTGPLLPCAGTAACGDQPHAARTAFDFGLLQWSSRTSGFGPTLTSSYIGTHWVDESGQLQSKQLRRTIAVTGLPELGLGGCPRGVDGAPFRTSATYSTTAIVTLGSQMLMPAVAFFNNTNHSYATNDLSPRARAVCKLHKSSLVLIASDAKDGLHWSYVTTIVSAAALPTTKEGPNEVAMMFLEEAGPSGTLVVIFRSDELHFYRADSMDHGRTWSAPFMLHTRSNDPSTPPMGAVQPVLASLYLSDQPDQMVRVLKGGRPGLFVWSSIDLHSRNWTESNIGAIHNELVTSTNYKFAPEFVAGKPGHQPQANSLQNHASNMVQLDSSSFLLYYDRSWWSRVPPANQPDMLFSMVVRLQKCSNENHGLDRSSNHG